MVKDSKKTSKSSSKPRYRRRKMQGTPFGKSFVRNVKRIVNSLAEDKQAFTTSGNVLVKFNSGIDSTADIQPLIPAMGQGVDTYQRIGEQITAKRLNVRGYVKLDINEVADSTKLPHVGVRMMILSLKNRPSYDQVTASAQPLSTLLRKGGTTTGFTGLISDLHAPINTDVFTIHHDKKFYLKQDYLNGIGASIPSQYVSTDVSKTIKFFNLSVKCKNKKLRYDEDVATDSYPVNWAPFLVMGYAYLSGDAPDVIDTKVGLSYDSTLTFEDA